MTAALDRALRVFDGGGFRETLARRVAHRTESNAPDPAPALRRYLDEEMVPALAGLGCAVRVLDNPVLPECPLLLGTRHEDDTLPTVLLYGHADVVDGEPARWRVDLDPWRLTADGDRWYGRGSADNKAQHSVNLLALEAVLATRGRLGFNLKVLVETGEERGSPGLSEACAQHRAALAADVLIASDGPRVAPDRPTVFLGSRGVTMLTLSVPLRVGAHHSGNWGGLLRNPATTLAAAIASVVDGHGRILVPGLRPPEPPAAVRRALAGVPVGGGAGAPLVDPSWGEPGLTAAERVLAWNSFEVLALDAGDPARPVGAIPGSATAHCQLRTVVGTDVDRIGAALAEHLAAHGLDMVQVDVGPTRPPTRTDPGNPWVRWALAALARGTGQEPVLLPNLGGTIPNDVFADVLGLPTVWIPHAHPGCGQHGPDEHVLVPVLREAVAAMTSLFADLGGTAHPPPGR
ncbi:M20 family metallopeptidase [Pseudonocardia sp. C8]|uniref:M20 family metallopeptidase n=1 Tax=Pseudonocardia sp. C8 TaxID=2762759 RepID=UPI0016435089|nr:M20 family metallopeptidase [Pseudonocardia sp. C8]MBC3191155.1 M20 family metallopeptidase [Pseudonocardia sp. C8]